MKFFCFQAIFLSTLLFAASGLGSDAPGQVYQEGLFQEYAKGDLSKAIRLYEDALKNANEDQELAAKCLLRLGICYELVGRDNDARISYQEIISQFPAQDMILDKAIKRLQKLSNGLVHEGFWFRYKDEHVYLIGAGTSSIYAGSALVSGSPATSDPVGNWKKQLDLLTQYGINFVRFHPWEFLKRSVVPDYACPWEITNRNKPTYNLRRFNGRYWDALRAMVSYANSREIFFEIVLFDDDSPWSRHPFNRAYGGSLKSEMDYYDLSNTKNREDQERYVSKVLDVTAGFSNVIYEICDGIGKAGKPLSTGMTDWVLHWVRFIENHASAPPEHLITISQPSWSSGGKFDSLWSLPGIDIISMQERNGTEFALSKGYTHKNLLRYWKANYQKPIMVNSISFGDMTRHPKGGTRGWIEERRHLWIAFTSGGHSARSDFQPFTFTYPSLDSCLHLAKFTRQVRFWEMTPLEDFVLDCDAGCYSICSDKEYVVYVSSRTQKNNARIRIRIPKGKYVVKWYDPIRGVFLPDAKNVNGGKLSIALPGSGTEIVMYVKMNQETN